MQTINKYISEKLVINKQSESEFSLQDCVIIITVNKKVIEYLEEHSRRARINCAPQWNKENHKNYMYRTCYIIPDVLLKKVKEIDNTNSTNVYRIPDRYDDIDQLIEGLEDCEYVEKDLERIK